MRGLHIVLAMAGRGSRFAKAGFTTPKPLIMVDGMPMFRKALSSLDGIQARKQYTIVIRKEHDRLYDLSWRLMQELPGVNVVMTDEDPIGAARDAVRSEAHLRPDEGVIVLDCDLWFQSASYNAMVEAALRDEDPIAGGLLTFPSDSPKYSYAKIDENGFVTETAEKRVISDRAITGAYFFGRASEFTEMAWYFLRNPLPEGMNEYYLSHLYNIMLERGGRIRTAMVDEFDSFGTPEELEAYEASRAA